MQVLKDLLVKGKAYLDGLINHTSGTITVLVIDGTEVKKKLVGSIVLKNDNEYLSSIVTSVPAHLQVTSSPSAPTSNNLTITLKSQTKNHVFAAPTTLTGTPGFRALVQDDIPDLAISKVVNLQPTLDSLIPPEYYFEDSLVFDANRAVNKDIPRYINLANHLDMQETGAYTFEIDLLLHANHRQTIGGVPRHYHIVASRKYAVSVVTDMTAGRARHVTELKTISHSGRWHTYNTSGTIGSSIIASGFLEEKYISASAFVVTNIPFIGISHTLNEHPSIHDMTTCLLYGKYSVKHNFLKTLRTS